MNIEEIRIRVAELQNQYVSVIKSLLALVPHADPNICQKQVRAFTQELLNGLEGKGVAYDLAALKNPEYDYIFSRMNDENGIRAILELLIQGYISQRILLDQKQ